MVHQSLTINQSAEELLGSGVEQELDEDLRRFKSLMKAGEAPDPQLINPRDAIIRVTSTAICGSDLHLYNGVIPSTQKGDILGHEFKGEVVEIGTGVKNLSLGDRVVVPFTIDEQAIYCCRKGGTVPIPGVYAGYLDKVPFGAAFGKGLKMAMGQTHAHHYLQPLLERVTGNGQECFDPTYIVTHRLPLDQAALADETFNEAKNDCVKVVLHTR
jgi:threonine dehydrogenase-like Zn-dependent dehydrogenase